MKKNTNKSVLKKFDYLCKKYEEILKKNIVTIRAATPEEVYVSLDVLCDVGKIDFRAINTKSNAWQYIRECENLFASKSLNYDWLNILDQMSSLEEKYPELDIGHEIDWVESSMRNDERCAYGDIFLELAPSYVCNVLMVNSKLSVEKFINLLKLSFGSTDPIVYTGQAKPIIHGNNLKYRHFKESCTQYYIDRLSPYVSGEINPYLLSKTGEPVHKLCIEEYDEEGNITGVSFNRDLVIGTEVLWDYKGK